MSRVARKEKEFEKEFTLSATPSDIKCMHDVCEQWKLRFPGRVDMSRVECLLGICRDWKMMFGCRIKPTQEGEKDDRCETEKGVRESTGN
jgi:hypothetical protein